MTSTFCIISEIEDRPKLSTYMRHDPKAWPCKTGGHHGETREYSASHGFPPPSERFASRDAAERHIKKYEQQLTSPGKLRVVLCTPKNEAMIQERCRG